jgi:hypothetical protein
MEERGAASGFGVGAWAAALFAGQLGIASAAYALSAPDATSGLVWLAFFCSLAASAWMIVGIRRRLTGCPHERFARLAIGVLVLGAIALGASIAVVALSDSSAEVLFRIAVASFPAAMLVACVAAAGLAAIPRWAPAVGAVGSFGALGLAVYRALPLPAPPGAVLAALHGICALLIAALWMGVWMAVSKETFIPRIVLIAGLPFVTAGFLSLTSFLQGQFSEHPTLLLNFALGVLQIEVGRGLLVGRRSSRRWAYVWLALWAAEPFGASIWLAREPSTASANLGTLTLHGASALPWVWMAFAIVVATSLALAFVLRSKSVSDYIEWSERVRAEWIAQAVERRTAATPQTAAEPVEPAA